MKWGYFKGGGTTEEKKSKQNDWKEKRNQSIVLYSQL